MRVDLVGAVAPGWKAAGTAGRDGAGRRAAPCGVTHHGEARMAKTHSENANSTGRRAGESADNVATGNAKNNGANGAPTDAAALLTADHRHVEELFQVFEKASSAGEKAHLAEQICNQLTVHTHPSRIRRRASPTGQTNRRRSSAPQQLPRPKPRRNAAKAAGAVDASQKQANLASPRNSRSAKASCVSSGGHERVPAN